MKKILFPLIAIIGLALSCQKAPEEVPVASITIGQTTAEMIIGETVQLTAIITPSNATEKSITWSSSKLSVATISSSGLVTAIAEGQSTVTASAGGKSATCTVIVSKGVVAVTSVTLNKTEIALIKGASELLIPTVNPADATDKTVTWTSSDAKVASVDSNGKVIAIGGGSAVITAKAGNQQATCTVSVTVPVEGVSLDLDAVTIEEESSVTLVAKITPDDATTKTVEWASSNAKIAVVDANGKVTGMAIGTATITAKVADKQATCAVTVVKKTIPVSSVTLNKTELALYKGQTETLAATVKPDDATNKTVTWSSSNTDVATVDSNGKVVAVTAGSATISAKAGDKEATCAVTVTIPVETVTLNKAELTIILGQEETLVATVKPDDATDKTVTWTSSNTAVATVDANGKVASVAVGTATITAKAGEKTATCAVSVIIPVESIALDKTSITLDEGQSETITATVAPDNATIKTVTWSSSDASIASVDQNGKVTAIKVGTATITAKAGEKTATCDVTVNKKVISVESIFLDKESLTLIVGNTATLTATVLPDDATDKTVTWKSSNTGAATVENGVIKGVGTGTATITATAGDVSATCTVSVVYDSAAGVYAQYYGGSIVSINGLIQSGSKLNFGVVNYSSETIHVVSAQLIDGETGNGGNVMSIGVDIASGSSTTWTITIGAAGIHSPKIKFVFTFRGETYTCEAQYVGFSW